MSVTYSYPGIYIQELPLDTHTITPAPTSIAAFIGYTHASKTLAFDTAVQLFSFSDYEANFGGLYTSGNYPSDVARAVYEFFLNGGTNAYVVGLQPNAYASLGGTIGTFGPPAPGVTSPGPPIVATVQIVPNSASPNNGMILTALEPTDVVPMTARIVNIRPTSPGTKPVVYDAFDLVVSYGTRIETYRNLGIGFSTNVSPTTAINGISSLVTVAPLPGGSLGSAFPSNAALPPFSLTIPSGTLTAGWTNFSPQDFIPAFQANSSLDLVEVFNLLLIPGVTDNTVVSAALAFAERKRAFAILDPPPQATAFGAGSIDKVLATYPLSQNGAIYFPYLKATDSITSYPIAMPPSGYVAGIYAATDASRGVWKAPAGYATTLLDTTGPVTSGVMNDMQQGVLNLASVNCIRSFTGAGTVVFGSRTLVSADPAYPQSVYVPVRRMTLFIEQTLVANLKWVVFEPNDEPLWIAIRFSIEAFLLSLFNQQALQGSSPSDAFAIKCDSTTTTLTDQQAGIVNIVVSVALLKPAEFVVIKIAQIAGQSGS